MTDHTTELAVRRQEIAPSLLTADQLKFISATEFVPKSMRGNLPAILACVATGRALGIPDMSALRSINIIDGKAAFSSELMVQLVRKEGHSITGTVTGEEAMVEGKRADNGDEMTCTWTLKMAERAGLLSKKNWQQYPEAMLFARAVSQLCRMLFADCFAGATYTPEEAELTTDELLDEEPVESDESQARTAELLMLADRLDQREAVERLLAEHEGAADFDTWLEEAVIRARGAVARIEEPVAS